MSRSSTPALPMYNASRQDLAPPEQARPTLTRQRTPVFTDHLSLLSSPTCFPRALCCTNCASAPKCRMVQNCLLLTLPLIANRHCQPCSPHTSGYRYAPLHIADPRSTTQRSRHTSPQRWPKRTTSRGTRATMATIRQAVSRDVDIVAPGVSRYLGTHGKLGGRH